MSNNVLTELQKKEILKLYEEGLNSKDILKKLELKCSICTIHYCLKKVHHKLRKPKHTDETRKKQSKAKIGSRNPNFGKITPSQKEFLKKGWEASKNRTETEKSRICKIQSEKRKAAWKNGIYENRINLGGNCKNYIVNDRVCKGTVEKNFLLKMLEVNPEIIQKVSSINTPFGNYTPDFKTNNKLIELKSGWTYECLLGLHNYIGDESKGNIKQLKKINWISEQTKLEIIVFYKNIFLSENDFINCYRRRDKIIDKFNVLRKKYII